MMTTAHHADASRPAGRATRLPSVLRLPLALMIAAALTAATSAVAMPIATPPAVRPTLVTKVLTTCDTRGCFTFGPRQSYHRPAYRPPGQTGPRYYSPNAAGPQRFLYRPKPTAPLPQARLPAADPSFHRQSCMNRYRSYNPLTDSYTGSGGRTLRCVLPDRR